MDITDREVERLKQHQENTCFHPFTCGGENCDRGERSDDGVLIPTNEGWICPCGDYKQEYRDFENKILG